MKFWGVKKDNNGYIFYAMNKGISDEGIGSITIKIKPTYGYSEVHARTYNEKTYRTILNAGKEHSLEKNSTLPNGKQKLYYFDSLYARFEDMNDSLVERTLSDERLMMIYLENSLGRCDYFKDNISCASNVEESLSVLAKADKNVEEIIEFIWGKICVQSLADQCLKLIGKNSLFSYTAQDKRYNPDILPLDLKEKIIFRN